MILGGIPFVLYVKYAYRGEFEFFQGFQVRAFLSIIALLVVMLTAYLWMSGFYTLPESFKFAAFNIVSIITTGYSTTDYTLWGAFPVALFFFLTYLGGCAGLNLRRD